MCQKRRIPLVLGGLQHRHGHLGVLNATSRPGKATARPYPQNRGDDCLLHGPLRLHNEYRSHVGHG